jgi:hypothetical protein
MVGTAGFEPATATHIEWLRTGALLTAKELEAGKVGKTGKIGDICYQSATKFLRITHRS